MHESPTCVKPRVNMTGHKDIYNLPYPPQNTLIELLVYFFLFGRGTAEFVAVYNYQQPDKILTPNKNLKTN